MNNVFENEKCYIAQNGVNVTYLEDPYGITNYDGEKKLLFIFQSLGDEKSNRETERFPWTMVNGFRYLNCRKIYIKDNYGIVGCYYLGMNGDFSVEEAVLEFIKTKIIEYGIALRNIMLYGNSKGGYAALDFGFRIGGVNVCSAVPQFDLYSWIIKYKQHLKYILPEEITEEVIELYSSYLRKIIIQARTLPVRVTIITSHNDNTYMDHIPALLESLKCAGIEPEIYYNDELYVTRHNNVVINSLNYIYYYILKWLLE